MSKPGLLLAFPFGKRLRALLEERYTLHGPPPAWEAAAIPPPAREVRAVVTLGGYRNDAGVLEAFPRLGLLHCYGTGHEGVDAGYCRVPCPLARMTGTMEVIGECPAMRCWDQVSA